MPFFLNEEEKLTAITEFVLEVVLNSIAFKGYVVRFSMKTSVSH